jgi:hypothetical protein
MNYLNLYVSFTLGVKILFIILLFLELVLKHQNKDKELLAKITIAKDRVENLFILLMSLLLIYLFNPFIIRSILLDYETKLLIFLFGFMSIILRFKK